MLVRDYGSDFMWQKDFLLENVELCCSTSVPYAMVTHIDAEKWCWVTFVWKQIANTKPFICFSLWSQDLLSWTWYLLHLGSILLSVSTDGKGPLELKELVEKSRSHTRNLVFIWANTSVYVTCVLSALQLMKQGNWAQIRVVRIWWTKVFLQQTMKAGGARSDGPTLSMVDYIVVLVSINKHHTVDGRNPKQPFGKYKTL